MKRWNIVLATAALLLSTVTLHAQGRGGGSANKPPKPNTTQAVKPQTSKPPTSKTQTAKAQPPKTQPPKPQTQTAKAHSPKTQPATAQNAKSSTKQNAKSSTKKTSTATASNTTSTTTGTGTTSNTGTSNTETTGSNTTSSSNTVTLTPVQQKLTKNTNLANKLQSRLPAGADLMKAADGFRNLGQFVAAVNVSNNLGIPFRQLKNEMVTENLSLGQAIQKLKPTVSGTVEAQRAEYDARGLIAESEQTTNTTTTTTPPTSSKKPNKNSSGGGSNE